MTTTRNALQIMFTPLPHITLHTTRVMWGIVLVGLLYFASSVATSVAQTETPQSPPNTGTPESSRVQPDGSEKSNIATDQSAEAKRPVLALVRSTRTAAFPKRTANPTRDRRPIDLADKVYGLIELELSQTETLRLVERREMAAALKELSISNVQDPSMWSLRLGQIMSAEFVALLDVVETPIHNDGLLCVVHLTHITTGELLDIVTAPVSEPTLDTTVSELVSTVVDRMEYPGIPRTTIAVTPIVSHGRFDRIRHLETGLRDWITNHLILENRRTDVQRRLRVLQRTNLEHVLAELDLAQSGLVQNPGTRQRPPGAAYLIRGTINEDSSDIARDDTPRDSTGGGVSSPAPIFASKLPADLKLVIELELVETKTERVIATITIRDRPHQLEGELRIAMQQLLKPLGIDAKQQATASFPKRSLELTELKSRGIDDLRRFRRISPLDFAPIRFALPGESERGDIPRFVDADSPQGRHLLELTIDRMETVLLLSPQDVDAQFALAFVLSYQIPNVYRPARADEIYRTIVAQTDDPKIRARALARLADVGTHHESAHLDPAYYESAVSALWLTLLEMPPSEHTPAWTRHLQRVLELECLHPRAKSASDALSRAATLAEGTANELRGRLAQSTLDVALKALARPDTTPETGATIHHLLDRWRKHDDRTLRDASTAVMASLLMKDKQFLSSAQLYLELAEHLEAEHDAQLVHQRQLYRIRAAEAHLAANQPAIALDVLSKEKPAVRVTSLLPGMYALARGTAHEELGDKVAALEAYLQGVNLTPTLVKNSDVAHRIQRLGGVPLADQRSIDVNYISLPELAGKSVRAIVADGTTLFLATHPQGVWRYRIDTADCSPILPTIRAQQLCVHRGSLWVGTVNAGLWQYDSVTDSRRQWTTADGLPDSRVMALSSQGDELWISVGTPTAGGLVTWSADRFHVHSEEMAPQGGATHIAGNAIEILARTQQRLHRWDRNTKEWSHVEVASADTHTMTPSLFSDGGQIWCSRLGQELFPWSSVPVDNERYQSAWYRNGDRAGYTVRVVVRQDDLIWFGGQSRHPLVSTGLYSLKLSTGKYTAYGPADGFRTLSEDNVYGGVLVEDRLWLATFGGLCTVTLRSDSP